MNQTKQLYISTKNLDMASVISQNNSENIHALLRRMGQEADVRWGKEVLATLLKDILIENPEYILYIYDKRVIDFLFSLWESDRIEATELTWAMIGQLKLLGFVDYKAFDESTVTKQQLTVIEEGKDLFYYYLKSKSSKIIMERYAIWESLLRGLMSHYGIISFQRLYYHFCKVIKSPIDDVCFHRFLSVRLELHAFGGFALEQASRVEYYQNYEITDPESVLEFRQTQDVREYFSPEYDDLIYIAENNGIGSWDGVPELAEIFLQLLEAEYYKTVLAVKTCIMMVQNGEDRKEIERYLFGTYPECRTFQDKVNSAISLLYDSVPVYQLKGWCRKSLRKKQAKAPVFTVIRGGRSDDN